MLRACALVFVLLFACFAQGERKRATAQERQQKEVEEMRRRARKSCARQVTSLEHPFLCARATALIERAALEPPGSYVYERLEDGIDNLLDAAGEIAASLEPLRDNSNKDKDEDPSDQQRDTARELERAYFRVLQADYFARQSREPDAAEYVQVSRRLYQAARAAYDQREHRRARRRAEAAREVVSALEALAQAAVRMPEPPLLK
jgi:hypothetical protein